MCQLIMERSTGIKCKHNCQSIYSHCVVVFNGNACVAHNMDQWQTTTQRTVPTLWMGITVIVEICDQIHSINRMPIYGILDKTTESICGIRCHDIDLKYPVRKCPCTIIPARLKYYQEILFHLYSKCWAHVTFQFLHFLNPLAIDDAGVCVCVCLRVA